MKLDGVSQQYIEIKNLLEDIKEKMNENIMYENSGTVM